MKKGKVSFFRNLGINKKIFLAQLFLILLIIPCFGAFYWSYKKVEQDFVYITDHSLVRVQALLSMKANIIQIANTVEKFVALDEKTPNFKTQVDDKKNEILAQIEQLKDLEKIFISSSVPDNSDPLAVAQEKNLLNLESNIILATVEISTLKEAKSDPHKTETLTKDLVKNVDSYEETVATLISRENSTLIAKKEDLSRSRIYVFSFLIFSLIFAIGVALMLTLVLARFIAKPIVELKEKAARIAAGDLTAIEAHSQDEIGDLQHSLNVMVQNIGQSEKMAAVGALATGIAHEISQPLAIIQNSVQTFEFLPIKEIPEAEVKDIVATVLRQITRASNIIKQMQDFAKQDIYSKSVLNLKESLEKILQEFTNKIDKKDILIKTDLATDLPNFPIEINQFKQMLLNILSNAQYAVDKRAKEEKRNYQKEIDISLQFDKDKQLYRFIISDNGIGMSPEILAHCFDPFFTGKEVGEGTGLGLTMVYNIVKRLNGKVDIKSEPFHGTHVTVVWPASI